MKGPEIHFPITIESADAATRKKRALKRRESQQTPRQDAEDTSSTAEEDHNKAWRTADNPLPDQQAMYDVNTHDTKGIQREELVDQRLLDKLNELKGVKIESKSLGGGSPSIPSLEVKTPPKLSETLLLWAVCLYDCTICMIHQHAQ